MIQMVTVEELPVGVYYAARQASNRVPNGQYTHRAGQ